MCEPKDKSSSALIFRLFVLLLLFPTLAHAKRSSFTTGLPFGMAFSAGVTQTPQTDFASIPQSSQSNINPYYSFEPFFDFRNVVIQLSGTFYSHPFVKGSGVDAGNRFSESSDASTFAYGGNILLAPWINEMNSLRGYFKVGYGQANTSIKNIRNYQDASGITTSSYTEKVKGSGKEVITGMGVEAMAVQNYSLRLEAGYRWLLVDEFSYESGTDVRGVARNSGEIVKDGAGTNKKFTLGGAFVNVVFALNF